MALVFLIKMSGLIVLIIYIVYFIVELFDWFNLIKWRVASLQKHDIGKRKIINK